MSPQFRIPKAPRVSMPHAKLLSTPKPKLSHVSIHPMKTSSGDTGLKVMHHLTNGHVKGMIFADPTKVGSHLMKLSRAQWRNPGRNFSSGVVHDIGEPVG
jgi:hypothetical protein